MHHSGLSSYVDNDHTHHTRNGRNTDTGNDENAYFNPTLQLDTQQLAEVELGPCLRRRAGGLGQSTAPLRPADLVTGEEDVDYVGPAYSADRRNRSDDPEVLPSGRPLGRSPFPFPNRTFFPSSPPSLRSISPAAPSSQQPLPTQHQPEQPQHNLKPYIPIPTPFEYSDDDEDDFRDYFDFDRAWAGSDLDPKRTARQQLEGSQELAESPDPLPGLSSSPSSTGSGTSCGTILTPKTPYEDQEYYDIMYKLDLGAESPYLGSAYAEAFGTHGCLLSQPPPAPPPTAKARARENTDSSSTNSNVDATSRASSSKHNTHCGICLRKAVSPCRTICCDRMFCRAHISDWLKSKESSGLCPSCDTVCVLQPAADESSSKTVLRKRRGSSASASPSHSRTPSSASTASTSTSSASSSCPESGSSTRVGTRSTFSSSVTLTSGDSAVSTTDGETEDLWDVKSTWKKNGGGSLDFVEMVRELMGDVVSGSMKFVGLSGGVRAAGGRRSPVNQQVKHMTTQPGTTDVERGFKFSPKELVKEVSGFTLGLGGVTEVEEADEIGEAGVAKRMVSIVGLLFVLFVLFR